MTTTTYRIDRDAVLAQHPELADTPDGDLWAASIAGDTDARTVLVARYVPLALKLAKKLTPRQIQWDQKIEIGNIALLTLTEVAAVGKCTNPENSNFVPIASFKISQAIQEWLAPLDGIGASPRTRRRWRQITFVSKSLTTETHTPTPAEIAGVCNDPAVSEPMVKNFLDQSDPRHADDYIPARKSTEDLDAVETDLAISQIERGLDETDPDLAATLRVMTEALAETGEVPSGAEIGRILGVSADVARSRIKALRPHMACLLTA